MTSTLTSTWQSFIDYMIARGNIDELMIISADTGALYASSDSKTFYLREYKTMITQEDGSEREENVNEATNIISFIKGNKPAQGLRINGKKKQQITRSFKDEETNQLVIITKFPQGGSCIASAGKCIIIGTFNEVKGHTSPALNETITLIANYLYKSIWPPRNDGESKDIATWQTYIDTMLVGKGNIAQALIIETSTGKKLASTIDFELQTYDQEIAQEDGSDKIENVNEFLNILKLLKGSKSSQGLRINKIKYQIIKSAIDENNGCYSVYGKKSMGGCGVVISGKCILIATFDEKLLHNAAGCQSVLSQLAKHLSTNLK